MHPDQLPDPKPVVHVSQYPQFVNQSDGSVRGYYPGEDWYVTGADRAEVISKLVAESERRMQDPAYIAQHFALAQQHLNGEAVTPGFEANTISTNDYQQRMGELGDQLRAPKHQRPDSDEKV